MNIKQWKEIVYTRGKLSERKVMKELLDYSFLIKQASTVYCHFTGLGKTNYFAETIISEIENRNFDKGITQDDLKGMIKETKTRAELVKELKLYFEL